MPDPFGDQPQNVEIYANGSEVIETQETHSMTHTATSTDFEHDDGRHEAGKRDVELYIRTYNTLLRSSGEISLKALVQAHYNIDSSLHPEARSPYPDMSALIYSVLRLPASIIHCNLVLLGQSEEVFLQQGFHVDGWEGVTASARRRKWFYDGRETLAASGVDLGGSPVGKPACHRQAAQELLAAHAGRLACGLCAGHAQVVGPSREAT